MLQQVAYAFFLGMSCFISNVFADTLPTGTDSTYKTINTIPLQRPPNVTSTKRKPFLLATGVTFYDWNPQPSPDSPTEETLRLSVKPWSSDYNAIKAVCPGESLQSSTPKAQVTFELMGFVAGKSV